MKLLVFAILVTAMTYTAAATGELGLRVTKPLASRASGGHSTSSNVLKLRKGAKAAKSSSYLKTLRAASASNHDRHDGDGVIPVVDLLSVEYVTEVAWNGIPVNVIIDTGSSDSWLVQDGFTCVDQQNRTQPQSNCMFGPPFQGTFDGGAISNQHFNLMYADLEFMTGAMGYETVTVAGITVEQQEVALVNYTYWFGDNVTSGLMGLAYPRLTSAFFGTNSSANDLDEQVPYDPIMTSMIKRGFIEPVFSLVLERDSDQGFLALGGLPSINQTGPFATTPILMVDLMNDPKATVEYSFYTIIADAYVYMGSHKTRANTGAWGQLLQNITVNTTQFPVIVDSGTTLMYLPTGELMFQGTDLQQGMPADISGVQEIYEDIMALYDPPAFFSEAYSSAVTSCNASVPDFGISIGGQVFTISQADMLLQSSVDPATGLCAVGVMDGGTGPYVLGDTFMNNVVSVFDIGAAEMRFAAHKY